MIFFPCVEEQWICSNLSCQRQSSHCDDLFYILYILVFMNCVIVCLCLPGYEYDIGLSVVMMLGPGLCSPAQGLKMKDELGAESGTKHLF